MREVLPALLAAHARGETAAVVTLVRSWATGPAPVGPSMLVTTAGRVVGSVGRGCVEGALVERAREVLATGTPACETYGVADDDAAAVGLSCGGVLEVFIDPVPPGSWPGLPSVVASLGAGEPVAVATAVRGPLMPGRRLVVREGSTEGSMGTDALDGAVRAEAAALLAAGASGLLTLGTAGRLPEPGTEVVVASAAPPPNLYILGANDVAAALCGLGRLLGYHVTVVDARGVFATPERLPDADQIVVDWPHRWLAAQRVDPRTAICVLSHDPKFDVPALAVAVRTPAGYVGALGSRRTHADRVQRLRADGLADDALRRIRSPIGLDLGGRTAGEIALSIAAQIAQERGGGSGAPLAGAQRSVPAKGVR